nr:immunoglobulin heavy chain junction region [Macaca mulatta]MOY21962.1 immunoglobulin heavy chain junction region [Macaca mulatta]MOY26028.1 immunoglobulin heavy chain junction region [Macaca mulatta]MOY27417.1 immunoglobulin heavy chain junction region [Macaca mulatta]MOY27524.1 immunoglobulin heavy chain junction region [Macaca mulatta]
CARGAYFDFW